LSSHKKEKNIIKEEKKTNNKKYGIILNLCKKKKNLQTKEIKRIQSY